MSHSEAIILGMPTFQALLNVTNNYHDVMHIMTWVNKKLYFNSNDDLIIIKKLINYLLTKISGYEESLE